MTGWREKADKARKTAKDKADRATEDELSAILEKADDLEGIFNELKLSDQATYDELITIVENATEKNEAIAAVVDRLKALGETGKKLAATVGDVAGAGALKMVLKALRER